MLAKNLTLAFRVLAKYKTFTILNVIGLGLAIAAFIWMMEYVRYEKSFDRFVVGYENIYRVQHHRFTNNQLLYKKAMCFPEVGRAMKESIPEVVAVGRLFPVSTNIEPVFTVRKNGEEKSFSEPNVFLADSGFINLFELELIHGNRTTALTEKNKVIISAATALKYFGRTDVVGEVLSDNMGDDEVLVTGVFRDLPSNSHFQFNILLAWFDVYGPQSRFTWDGFYTYLRLRPGSDLVQLNKKIDTFSAEYMQERYANQPGSFSKFELQSLASIHLHSHAEGEIKPNGNYSVTLGLTILAGLIIAIALINYINLNTSRSLSRLREVGIRKVMGSSYAQLSAQFLAESFITVMMAFLIGVSILIVGYPYLNNLFATDITLNHWVGITYWSTAFAAIVAATCAAGFYPAFVLTRQRVLTSLKGQWRTATRSRSQLVLTGIQFGFSLLLLTAAYLVTTQLHYMQTRQLGFRVDQKLVIKLLPGYQPGNDSLFRHKLESMKASLQQQTFVQSSAMSSSIPGRKNEWRGPSRLATNDAPAVLAGLTRIDKDFIDTFGMKLVAGKNYSSDDHNLNSIIINEEAARQFGFEKPQDAIGKKMLTFREREIVGVVASFHESGLHDALSPALFITGEGYMKFLTIALQGEINPEKLEIIQQTWTAHFRDKPFEFFFLDDFFNRQYQNDQIAKRSTTWFAAIGLLITCLGLLSLAIQLVHQKTKEIGIRKVLGASAWSVTGRLTNQFALPLIIGAAVVLPVGYYVAQQWLAHYAYRIELNASLFLVPLATLTVVGLVTTLTQTWKAANRNPVDIIKYE